MTTAKPMTAIEFMETFERKVEQYGDEFFFQGARDLLGNLRNWGLEQEQQSVDQFLCECLIHTKKNPYYPPNIDDVRAKLQQILGFGSSG